ncbi:hypothetical protein KPH14_012025 [Odynerus spinipes]|uniref:Uncharacterized protein n=1 Tax=Odynerus spinipes TaxID=1348599 RepID=A0AAD9VKW9_9HYME|nr:hypothetical protein KPH14_012025 [Odynerus spinipes]
MMNPPEDNRYDCIKDHLFKRFTDSAERQLHKLLSEIALEDRKNRKPAQLLRAMKDLTNNKASDELLRTKWLGLLPTNVH